MESMECTASSAAPVTAKSPFAHLYKQKGLDWKSEFRKGVNRRLRNSRNNLVDRFRKMNVQEKKDFLDSVVREDLLEGWDKRMTPEELDRAIAEYEEFREEFLQQEFDDVLMAEEECLLEEISCHFDSNRVLCPCCKKSLLSFPDKRSFSCWMCSYLIKLPYDLPSPPHLLKTFEDIFSAHSEWVLSECKCKGILKGLHD
ncbi:unnamed protein product [Enterobius vermicularis]|uniref:RPA_interact_N domain-containing protein n=1 Tax=Enterobius vermicularis TaxID=51028 RepID=A0A0N4V6M1_ENTVE|nr:unnamed protein product [Enterobius vermicularis]